MGIVFELVRSVNRFSNHKKAKKRGGPVVAGALEAFRLVSDSLALLSMEVATYHEEVKDKRCRAMGLDRDDVEAKITARTQAREDRDWALADTLRDELDAAGVLMMDGADGTSWRLRICEAD